MKNQNYGMHLGLVKNLNQCLGNINMNFDIQARLTNPIKLIDNFSQTGSAYRGVVSVGLPKWNINMYAKTMFTKKQYEFGLTWNYNW